MPPADLRLRFNPLKSGQLFQISLYVITADELAVIKFQSPKIGSVVSNKQRVIERCRNESNEFQSPKIGSVVSNLNSESRKALENVSIP